ncbi:hypothetical protein Glove_461g45 [Diversispora epigaea]|uniref:Galactose oxidase n=1 Tax=Diversispora epigaea TaxID=1348612 RepID=A0A397GSF3_9GLOM|nr:hypothetical protein Glove_461g45 [Diversispora epigaea]
MIFRTKVYTYTDSIPEWSPPLIISDKISPRQKISGVIDNSGIIYIFGGFNATNFTDISGSTGELYNDMNILNTTSIIWTKLSITENLPIRGSDYEYSANILLNGTIVDQVIPAPPYIYGHTANLYYNYMIITFGILAGNDVNKYNSQVYLYNNKNKTWVTSYDPPPQSTPPYSSSSPIIKPLIIGLGIGIGILIIISCLICLYIFQYLEARQIDKC